MTEHERKPRPPGGGPKPSEYALFNLGDEHAAALAYGGEPAACQVMEAALEAARAARTRLLAETSPIRARGWAARLGAE